MLDQRVGSAANRSLANRPNVIRRNHGHAVKQIVTCGGVGAFHDGPGRAVPMLDHGAVGIQTKVISRTDCPDVVIRGGGHA